MVFATDLWWRKRALRDPLSLSAFRAPRTSPSACICSEIIFISSGFVLRLIISASVSRKYTAWFDAAGPGCNGHARSDELIIVEKGIPMDELYKLDADLKNLQYPATNIEPLTVIGTSPLCNHCGQCCYRTFCAAESLIPVSWCVFLNLFG